MSLQVGLAAPPVAQPVISTVPAAAVPERPPSRGGRPASAASQAAGERPPSRGEASPRSPPQPPAAGLRSARRPASAGPGRRPGSAGSAVRGPRAAELDTLARIIAEKCAEKHRTVRAAWRHLDYFKTGAATIRECERMADTYAFPREMAHRFFRLMTEGTGADTISFKRFQEVCGPIIQPGHSVGDGPWANAWRARDASAVGAQSGAEAPPPPRARPQSARAAREAAPEAPPTQRARPQSARAARAPDAAGSAVQLLRSRASEAPQAGAPPAAEEGPAAAAAEAAASCEAPSVASASTAPSPRGPLSPSSSAASRGSSAHGGSSTALNERRSVGMTSFQSTRGGTFGWVPDQPRSRSVSVHNMTFDSSQILSFLRSKEIKGMSPQAKPLCASAMTPRPPSRPRSGPARPTGAAAAPWSERLRTA